MTPPRLLPLAATALLSAAAVALAFKLSVAALDSSLPAPARPLTRADFPAPEPGSVPEPWTGPFRYDTAGVPPEVTALIQQNLPRMAEARNSGYPNPKALRVRPPLGGYQLDSEALLALPDPAAAADLPLSSAKPQVWEYTVENSGKPLGSVTVTVAKGPPRIVSAGGTQNLQMPLFQALAEAAALERVKAGSFEPRVLFYPTGKGSAQALWLRAAPGGEDVIIPLLKEPLPLTGLRPGTPYSPREFLTALLPVLQRLRSGGQRGGG
jgi:hypothetical protein